jgi:periplasmic copper chaperone A
MNKFFLAAVLALSAPVWAQTVKVEDAWVRGTVAQQKATGAFMRLTAEKNIRLVAVSSPVAGVVEIHEMAMDKDVMKMRAVDGLDLVAGKTTELKPGGYHVMLMDLKQPVKTGDSVALTLVFEGTGKTRSAQELVVPVRALSGHTMQGQGMQHGKEHQH